MEKKLTIIKLGGSILTNKSQPYTIDLERIKLIAKEIKQCLEKNLIEKLILVNGVGSFGHPPVLEYKLHLGFQRNEQLIPLSKTQHIVNKFRLILAKELRDAGIPINLMHASSLCIGEKGKINDIFTKSIKGYLSIGKGMIPLIGGDMIYDQKMGFSVGSGDQIAAILAKKLNATRLIFATDVEGIYNKDPKIDTESKIILKTSFSELNSLINKLDSADNKDASGMIKGKLKSFIYLKDKIAKGLEIDIFSMKTQGNLIKLLEEKLISYTKIVDR